MDTGEQPYDDRHNVPPRKERFNPFDTLPKLSIPDAIDAVREYQQSKRTALPPRIMSAMMIVTDELESRFNAEQAPVPMPKHDKNYTLDKAIDDTGRAVRLNHLGHYTGMVSMVLDALRAHEDLERARDVEQTAEMQAPTMYPNGGPDPFDFPDGRKTFAAPDVDPPGPMPGTPLDTQSGLRYIAPGGTFAAYWTGEGNGPQLAQVSLLNLRILAAHLTTAIDHVTGELELRRH